MVIAILGFFIAPSPALIIPSPALIIPLPPVNKFPNKLAPNVPNNMLKNPPFVLLLHFQLFCQRHPIKCMTFLKL